MKKVLFFADWYLPGRNGGGAVTALANLVELLGDEFAFYVFTRDRDSTDAKPYAGVPLDRWVPVGRAQVLYTSDLSFRNIRRRIRELSPDVLYLGSFFSRLTVKALLLRRLGLLPVSPVVLAPRGEFGSGALTLKRLRKWVYFKVALPIGICRELLWHRGVRTGRGANPPAESSTTARGRSPTFDSHTLSRVRVFSQRSTSISKTEKRSGQCRFVFLSRIARNKNLRFALDLLASTSGQVDFDIYGPVDDATYWAECSARMQTLPPNVRVNYFGPIPYEAVPNTLAAYDFLLLPTLGENFGYVILEALSAGSPVIISDQSPWRNLQAVGVGWDISLSQRDAWQSAVRKCVEMDGDRYSAMSERARSFMHEWAASIDFREEHRALFQEALGCREDRSPHRAFGLQERDNEIGRVRPTT